MGAAAVWGGESGEVGRRRGKAGAIADDGTDLSRKRGVERGAVVIEGRRRLEAEATRRTVII
jgi:hypothetical protein